MKKNRTRTGIKDLWNANLLKGASWTKNENPVVRTTATKPPQAVVSYKEAKLIDKQKRKSEPDYKINAFIHFYTDDCNFDGKRTGIWVNPNEFFRIASHFAGVIGPDFSTYADFPKPHFIIQIFKIRTLEYACAKRNIPVIINARWGHSKTWDITIEELPSNSMLAIGTVGSGLKFQENQGPFEKGFDYLLERKQPHTLVVIGSASYPCFEKAKKQGVKIVQFDGDTCKYFKKRKEEKR